MFTGVICDMQVQYKNVKSKSINVPRHCAMDTYKGRG